MDSYEIGFIIGRILPFIIFIVVIWGIVKLYKNLKIVIFSNPTKELLKTYLFWSKFVEGITTTDEFKKRLKKIKNSKVYKDEFSNFYLTKQEAISQQKQVKELTIKEVLKSKTYPLNFAMRLERITMYDTDDLKFISKDSKFVWIYEADILMHFVLNDDKFIYPKDYSKNSKYRFGYTKVFDENGNIGVYDVEQDKLILPIIYKHIYLLGNLAEISINNKEFKTYNLDAQKTILTINEKYFPHLSFKIKEYLNIEKVELKDIVKIFSIKTRYDLEELGLWGEEVAVSQISNQYKDIIEDSDTGTIMWNHYCSADIYDMSIELPINFKKKNGDYISLGIKPHYLYLEDRSVLRKAQDVLRKDIDESYKELKNEHQDENVPNYLKIKNEQFDNVDFINNTVDEIIKLTSDEFNEFISITPKSLIFTYLSTLSEDELLKFYKYNDDIVKLEDEAKLTSREQFEGAMLILDIESITNIQKQRATLEIPLNINYAKHIYHQAIDFKKFIQSKYYPYKEDDLAIRYEGTLFKTIYSEQMKFIPDYFEQVLTHFSDFYDEKNDEHKKIGIHLAKRFGLLINSLYVIQKATDEKFESLAWFLYTFNDEIKKVDGYEIMMDDELIFYLMNRYASIIQENDDSYITSLIDVVKTLQKFYPFNSEAFLYALQKLMKSVALKSMSIKNANDFLTIFEELPRFYDVLSYEKIIELKEMIKQILIIDKPQDNKIFYEDNVKNKLILLNYKVDMEDLYYESRKGK